MAEIIFRNLCVAGGREDVFVASAGLDANGETAQNALDALKICDEKVPQEKKKSVRFEPFMITEYDLIICMTRFIARCVGEHENVKTLDDFVGCGDIPDPFGYPPDVYIEVCKRLQSALALLYTKLCN